MTNKKKLTLTPIFEPELGNAVGEKIIIKRKPNVFRKKNTTAQIKVTLQSPEEQLRQYARILPNGSIVGQVTNSKTLNYKTLKPEPGGLFCERIFGPVTTNVCACGKRRPNSKVTYCKNCEVEYITSRARRYRIGFIELAMPMAHIWYLKGRPSYISLLLDIKQKEAEKLAYGQYWIYRNFTLDFEKRIRHLRAEFNENAYRFNHRGYATKERTYFAKDINPKTGELLSRKARRDKRLIQRMFNYSALDFWVHSPTYHQYRTNGEPKIDGYRVYYNPKLRNTPLGFLRKCFFWTKRAFFFSKPFYRTPLIRDSLIGFYDREREYNRTKITEDYITYYLFPFRREFGVLTKYQHKRALKNSMIYHKNFEFTCLITGGDAFRHLFSKIDCFRMYSLIWYRLLEMREKMRSTDRLLRRKFGLEFKHIAKFKKKKRRRYLSEALFEEYKYGLIFIPKLARKMKLFKIFWRTGTRPEWMFISYLPIIPPDLRPILKLNGSQLAVSDLNRLYQFIFIRNKNLKEVRFTIYKRALNLDFSIKNGIQVSKIDYECDFQTYQFTLSLLSYHTNQVQRALDGLFDNSKGGNQALCGFNDRPLKSLSEILKGKSGRFRQNLLGKRVDYSGRSVIVVGPTLKLHQCGLPKEIALELFQPLLIRKMILLNLSKTIVGAKKLIHQDHPIIWHLLNDVMTNYPILLNRAPTLHRLGVQAFLPKLVRGKAILLHPLVCPAFNADFDGDQMGVHLPISLEAKSEAWSLMLATQNILSPATGEPILVPSQDMVLGCYYSTTINLKSTFQEPAPYYNTINDAYKTYQAKNLHPHKFIWLKWDDKFESNQPKQAIIEVRLKRYQKKLGQSIFIAPNAHQTFQPKVFPNGPIFLTGILINQYIKTTIGRILINKLFQDNIINFKRKYSNYFTRTRNGVILVESEKVPTKYTNTIMPLYVGYLSSNELENTNKGDL